MTDDIAGLIERVKAAKIAALDEGFETDDSILFGQARDALSRLSQRVDKLESENFALAAGQCVHPDDGLSSDDGGTQYCEKQRRIAELEADLDSWRDQCSQRVADWDEMRKRAEAMESQLAARVSAEPVVWETTEKAVCVPLTKSASIAQQWRENGYPVVEYFAHSPAAPASELTDSDVFTLIGHAELLHAEGQHDMPAWFLGLAERMARSMGRIDIAKRCAAIAAEKEKWK